MVNFLSSTQSESPKALRLIVKEDGQNNKASV